MNKFFPVLVAALTAALPAPLSGSEDGAPDAEEVAVWQKSALPAPGWFRDAVVYEVYLRAFSPGGKLHELENRFSELKGLGVTCLDLLPVHPVGVVKRKGERGSPHAVRDYFGVNIEYGTKDGFKSFVQEAHLAGFKVIIDWVADRTAWDNPLLESHPEWYVKDASGNFVAPSADEADTAALDYGSPELRMYMRSVMLHWVKEYDIDGFRCSSAERVPLDFWESVREELGNVKPQAVLIAQGGRPEGHLRAFHAAAAADFFDALFAVAQGASDATALAEYLRGERERYPQAALHVRYSEGHGTFRSRSLFGDAHAALATLVFTLDGVPLIYNGQEIGAGKTPSLHDKETLPWEIKTPESARIRKFYKALCRLRTAHPALSRGQRFPVFTSDDSSVFAFAASYRGDAVLVAVNLSPRPFSGNLEVPEIFRSDEGELKLKPALSPAALSLVEGAQARLTLEPWGAQVWELK